MAFVGWYKCRPQIAVLLQDRKRKGGGLHKDGKQNKLQNNYPI
jgi:hypothetical protein